MKGISMLGTIALALLLLSGAAPVGAQDAVPIGKERRARDWEGDVKSLLFDRRVGSSHLVGGLGGIAFNPKDCMSCHENDPDVEGQVFYGPDFKGFEKDQWPEMLTRPEKGETPARAYDFVETHEKKVKLIHNVFPAQVLRQNP